MPIKIIYLRAIEREAAQTMLSLSVIQVVECLRILGILGEL